MTTLFVAQVCVIQFLLTIGNLFLVSKQDGEKKAHNSFLNGLRFVDEQCGFVRNRTVFHRPVE